MIQDATPTKKARTGWLTAQARPARRWIVLAVTIGFAGGCLLIAQAYLIARIVNDAAIGGRTPRELTPLFLGFAAVITARAALGWVRESAGFQAGAAVRESVRMSVMTHLLGLGPAFINGRQTGALASVALEQAEGLHNYVAHYLPQTALAVMIPLAVLAVVFPVSWAAGTLLLISAPMIPMFMILVGMGAESISRRHFQALARMSAHFLDTLQGLSTLKLFHRSRDEKKNIADVSRKFRRRTMEVLRIAFISSAVLEFFSALSIALVAVFLGMKFLGYVDFGTYGKPLTLTHGLFILLLAPDFYLALRELGTHYHARADAIGASEAIVGVLAHPLPRRSSRDIPLPPATVIHIHVTNLHLAYDNGRRQAVAGVDLTLAPGEKTALVGTSGAGKTTLLNLILGFHFPDRGDIRINGINLREISLESWHRHVAWIGQHTILFYGTVRENIRMGRPGASDDDVFAAAHAARVTEFTDRMPRGLDTNVGERGAGLSRGQVQRVALARAFLKNAPVILLDEPTAGLDRGNEQKIMAALAGLTEGRTLLMATHRLAALENVDRILVMAEGRIVEAGTYDRLTALGGVFDRFVRETTGASDHA